MRFDHWSSKVRRSVLIDSKADILLYGNAERAIIEVSHRLARGDDPVMYDVRGITLVKQTPDTEVDMSSIDDTNERTVRQDDEQVIRLPSWKRSLRVEVYTERTCASSGKQSGMRARWYSNTEPRYLGDATADTFDDAEMDWVFDLPMRATPCLWGCENSRMGYDPFFR